MFKHAEESPGGERSPGECQQAARLFFEIGKFALNKYSVLDFILYFEKWEDHQSTER